MKQVCLYFGSFNPIHRGHLALARHVLSEGYADELWFVLSPSSPHKQGRTQLLAHRRAHYIQEAIEGEPRLCLCRIEEDLPRPNYTVRTLRAIELLHPETRLSLLIGADNLMGLASWHDYQRLLEGYRLLVYPRAGYSREQLEGQIRHLSQERPGGDGEIILLDAPLLEYSSTAIRRAALEGKDLRESLPHSERWDELSLEIRSLSSTH